MSGSMRQALRKQFQEKRAALPEQLQKQAANDLCKQLQKLDVIRQARTISGYLAFRGEIDLAPFIQWSWQNQKAIALPVLHPFSKGYLLFQRYTPDTLMKDNAFGIAEPALSSGAVLPLEQLDVILLPLVAFDEHKNRMGMGGGFYDRTLASVRVKHKKAVLIGVAHDCQYYDNTLPTESWDVPLDYVVTPGNIR